MCGILAIKRFNKGGSRPELSALVNKGLEAMRHRGPDDHGAWVASNGSLGMGAARLAIVGVANGCQPLRNEDGTVAAVVNGEFYDFEALRKTLESAGHLFSTDSDSELIIHLYEEYGLECFRHLRGEFALILWDDARQRLVAAPDRFGVKPLHYSQVSGEWLLASEIKALIAIGFTSRWNVRAYDHALTHQYLPPGESLFAGVRQIPSAHYLIIEGSESRLTSYWRPPFPPADHEPTLDRDAVDQVRKALEEAVVVRLRADVPIACTLSGGLDSSAVAALAARNLGRPLACFSVRFDEAGYDEGALTHANAEALGGLEVNEVCVGRRDLARELERAVWYSEGLTINGQLVGKFMLSRAIHEAGYKVALAGEGADEAFLGYAHLQHDHGCYDGDSAADGLHAEFALQRGVMLPVGNGAVNWQPPGWLGFVPSFIAAKLAIGRQYLPLAEPETRRRLTDEDHLGRALGWIHDSEELGMNPSSARKSAWLWTRLALGNYILRVLGDGAEMAHSVEARLPYLDHHLFELVARLPTGACFRGTESKAILRDALVSVLPDSVRLRPKHPFLSPPLLTSGDPVVREFVADTLRSEAFADVPFFHRNTVLAWSDRLFEATPEEQTLLDPVLMTLLSSTFLQKQYRMTL
jgi:asparagine synthase (glutamine-hydrolysing)